MNRPAQELAARQRRSAIRWLNLNALVFGLGDGMVSTALVVFLADHLGARGLIVGLILAAPSLMGLLRLAAPFILAHIGRRKRFCVTCFALAGTTATCVGWAVIFFPKLVALPPEKANYSQLALLTELWSVFHLFIYLGSIALWSWLRDIVPLPLRSTMIGRREWYLVTGKLFGLGIAAQITGPLEWKHPDWPAYLPYLFTTTVGGLILILSSLPLLAIAPWEDRARRETAERSGGSTLADLTSALGDRRFRPLLVYSLWQAFSSALTGPATPRFYREVFVTGPALRLAADVEVRVGQSAIATEVGRWIRRVGAVRVMWIGQILVTISLVFLWPAGRETWWLVFFWAACLIAYVGINVGEADLLLKIPPREKTSSYLAAFFALSGICGGLGSVIGGLLFESLGSPNRPPDQPPPLLDGLRLAAEGYGLSRFQLFFLAGIAARAWAIWLICRIRPE